MRTFLNFHRSGYQFVMNVSKFQFQIYKTSHFTFRVLLRKDNIVFVLGFFGFIFFFRDKGKDWSGHSLVNGKRI